VTTRTSGTSMIPALRNCRASPEPGCTTTATVSADLGHLGLGLADADGLDHHDVERHRERLGRRAGGGREAAEPPGGGHRANEQPAVGRVGVDPRARSPSSAPPERLEEGSTASTATVRSRPAPAARERAEQHRLARPGRPGDADHVARGRRRRGGPGPSSGQQRRASSSRRARFSTRFSAAGAAPRSPSRPAGPRARRSSHTRGRRSGSPSPPPTSLAWRRDRRRRALRCPGGVPKRAAGRRSPPASLRRISSERPRGRPALVIEHSGSPSMADGRRSGTRGGSGDRGAATASGSAAGPGGTGWRSE
jgi:hypothetical protein